MAPSLLQKSSNRYLQLTLPENLIPSKRMGKREKYRVRVAYNNHSRMEKELCREWAFSWNTLKEKIKKGGYLPGKEKRSNSHLVPETTFLPLPKAPEKSHVAYSEIDFHRVKLSAPFPWVKWRVPVAPVEKGENALVTRAHFKAESVKSEKHAIGAKPFSLILPHLFTRQINGAVGGNLLQHLNHSSNFFSFFSGGEKIERHSWKAQGLISTNYAALHVVDSTTFFGDGGYSLCVRSQRQPPLSENRKDPQISSHPVPLQEISSRWLRFSSGANKPGTDPLQPSRKNKEKTRKSLFKEHHRGEIVCATSKEGHTRTFGDLIVSAAPYFIRSSGKGYRRGDDFLTEQAKLNNFRIIYSLEEKGKAATRRDKINDDYRNQLAEWRKIAFLYGNLAKKTIVRVMQQARGLRGDINSNCISLLEARLDVALKRSLFFPTVKAARQWIVRGKIYVNNQRCTLSGALLQPGDVVSVTPPAQLIFRKQCLGTLREIKKRFLFAAKENRGRVATHEKPDSIFLTKDVSAVLTNKETCGEEKKKTTPGLHSLSRAREQGGKERRFPFSPELMRKWNEWSQLWGGSSFSTGNRLQRHSWLSRGGKRDKYPVESLHNVVVQHSSLSTSYAHYLSALNKQVERLRKKDQQGKGEIQLDFLQKPIPCHPQSPVSFPPAGQRERESPESFRRETFVSQMLHAGGISPGGKEGVESLSHKGKQFFEKGVQPFFSTHRRGPPVSLFQGGGSNRKHQVDKHPAVSTFSPATNPVFADKYQSKSLSGAALFGTNPEKNTHCHWLHKQQSCVIDGCFPLRWNKFFARKKSWSRKNHHWRWSCFKPLHLECSHKQCTFIFLYPPQKLLWPGSINMSLLWKRVASD